MSENSLPVSVLRWLSQFSNIPEKVQKRKKKKKEKRFCSTFKDVRTSSGDDCSMVSDLLKAANGSEVSAGETVTQSGSIQGTILANAGLPS